MNVPAVCTDCRPTPLEQAAAARTHPQSADAARLSKSERAAADPLSLSATATAAKDMAAAPPVDGGKVASLKAAIADGSYAVDPLAIAGKMIALDLP